MPRVVEEEASGTGILERDRELEAFPAAWSGFGRATKTFKVPKKKRKRK